MACFLVPTTEAIVTTIATKALVNKEKEEKAVKVQLDGEQPELAERIPFTQKLKWLNGMLWGGAILLAFEHIWHGEVVPWFPFLTAMGDPGDAAEMLHEMATSGVGMAVLVTLVWIGMVVVSNVMEKRALAEPQKEGAR